MWEWGVEIKWEEYDDCYYGEWVECQQCHCHFDWTNVDDRYADDDDSIPYANICQYCGENLVEEFKRDEKQQALKNILEQINNVYGSLEEETYRRVIVDAIYNTFNISREGAELVYDKCLFLDNQNQNEEHN